MSLLQLRNELRIRQVKSTGRKAELVARLEALDSIQSTSTSHLEQEENPHPSSLQWPGNATFKSLTSEMKSVLPPVTKSHLEQYIIYRQQNDKAANADLSAMKQGALLSKEKVVGLSVACHEDAVFFCGAVEATMKKNLIYTVRFALDKHGEVQFSWCECPAGEGPTATCKHIVASLLVVLTLQNEGKMLVSSSCTDSLQSFHKPRKLSSAPVKAELLGKGIENRDLFDDPRPRKYKQHAKEGYQDLVNMLTVNYCSATNRDSNWRFKFGKADIQTAANHDHLYEKIPCTQH